MPASTWAALLYLLPAVWGLAAWVVVATVGIDSLKSAAEVLTYLLNETPERMFFRWFLAIPLVGLTLSIAYFSSLGRHKRGLVVLLLIGALHMIAAWSQLKTSYAIGSTIALLSGVIALKESLAAGPARTGT